MGVDQGEGKGAPFDATDDSNANAIDLETELPPDSTEIEDNIEDTEKQHEGKPCFDEGDILKTPEEMGAGDRQAMTNKNKHWKKYNGIVHVPYILSSSFSTFEHANIDRAFMEYEKNTCIRYKEILSIWFNPAWIVQISSFNAIECPELFCNQSNPSV